MMQMWTMRDVNDCYAPGSTGAEPYRVFDEMKAMGYPANVAVSYDIQFHRYLRPGERAMHYTSVATISDPKSTALGHGYFVTERVEYLTLDDDAFAEALITYYQYAPVAGSGESTGRRATVLHAGNSAAEGFTAPPENKEAVYRRDTIPAPAVGDSLPSLAIPITRRLIVAGAIASQDFTPVHHDQPAACAAGMPDIFMNILTTCGLSARYLTDWAGSAGRLTQIRFKLLAPNLPGDLMRFRGEVIAVNPSPSCVLVEVAFAGENSLGTHICGTAELALPNPIG